MERIDEAISAQAYVLDVLLLYRDISKLPTCNECAIQRSCPHVPKAGQIVRYNCFNFVGKDGEKNDR